MRSDKALYAIPAASQTMLVVYNKDLFNKYGITEPASWDEFLKDCETLTAAGVMPFANGTATGWQNETIVSALTSSIMGKGFYGDLMAGHHAAAGASCHGDCSDSEHRAHLERFFFR